MKLTRYQYPIADPAQPIVLPEISAEQPQAWEEIETGRFQPKRIKGSLLGRELG